MKNNFSKSALPQISWYIGEVVEDDGEIKLEWTDPEYGKILYSEEQLAMIEQSARDMLINRHQEVAQKWGGWTVECHTFWRDRHYNAELGLEKLQRAKRNRDIALDLDFRPVIR